jgi:hypothetical protein
MLHLLCRVPLLSQLTAGDADAVLHDVELSLGSSGTSARFQEDAAAVLDRFLAHAAVGAPDPAALMTRMCAEGAAEICVRDRETMLQLAATREPAGYSGRVFFFWGGGWGVPPPAPPTPPAGPPR